jgi:transcriptional regulator GlxA family with amidase domain
MITENQLMESAPRNGWPANGGGAGAGGSRLNSPRWDEEKDTAHKLARSLAYMEENLNKPLQVSALAAQANVSPSHFFALFKQLTGRPPMDYFTRLRMRHACRLLDSTSARVKEVAAALGYDDPFYFSRVFKAVNHVPPSRYRSAKANNFTEPPRRLQNSPDTWHPILT